MKKSIKKTLRKHCLENRNAVTPSDHRHHSNEICQKIIELLPDYDGVLAYYPIGTEVDIRPVMDYCVTHRIPLYLPKTSGRDMEYYRVESLNGLLKGAFGVPEPIECEESLLQKQLQEKESSILILVPGVGFDVDGNRLGYGAGFYDRWFARGILDSCFEVTRAGICFQCQLVQQVYTETTDVAMDVVITEKM